MYASVDSEKTNNITTQSVFHEGANMLGSFEEVSFTQEPLFVRALA